MWVVSASACASKHHDNATRRPVAVKVPKVAIWSRPDRSVPEATPAFPLQRDHRRCAGWNTSCGVTLLVLSREAAPTILAQAPLA
jgi:hypothetical protein